MTPGYEPLALIISSILVIVISKVIGRGLDKVIKCLKTTRGKNAMKQTKLKMTATWQKIRSNRAGLDLITWTAAEVIPST